MTKLKCSICGSEVERKSNAQKYCRECAKRELRKYRRKYYKENREKYLTRNREWRKKHPEYHREWQRANPDKVRDYHYDYTVRKFIGTGLGEYTSENFSEEQHKERCKKEALDFYDKDY